MLAWETNGLCLGTIAPTTAIVKPGCPSEWVVGTAYVAGSLVSKNGQILKCKSTAAMPTLDKPRNLLKYLTFLSTLAFTMVENRRSLRSIRFH